METAVGGLRKHLESAMRDRREERKIMLRFYHTDFENDGDIAINDSPRFMDGQIRNRKADKESCLSRFPIYVM